MPVRIQIFSSVGYQIPGEPGEQCEVNWKCVMNSRLGSVIWRSISKGDPIGFQNLKTIRFCRVLLNIWKFVFIGIHETVWFKRLMANIPNHFHWRVQLASPLGLPRIYQQRPVLFALESGYRLRRNFGLWILLLFLMTFLEAQKDAFLKKASSYSISWYSNRPSY